MMTADDELLLNAYVDGELDAAGAIEIERRLAVDQELGQAHARLLALRKTIQTQTRSEPAPEALRARILAAVIDAKVDERSPGANAAVWPRLAVAASLAIAAGVAAWLTMQSAPTGEGATMKALLASHMRSQISGRPVDIASNDRHEVKPWFAAKLPVAAVVVDLASEGFPLIGGRIDIVEAAPAPTLVFRRRDHLISLTELPARGDSTAPSRLTQQGYPIESWSDSEHAYVAISDVAPAELRAFASVFREAARRQFSAEPGATK